MALLNPIPSPVEETGGAVLEWPRLLELLAGYSHSALGRKWILDLVPSSDRVWLERQHGLVDEMRLLLEQGASVPLSSLFDPTTLLDKARIPGAALEPEELRALINLMDDIGSWQGLMKTPPARVADRLPQLLALSAPLLVSDLKPLLDSLREKILPDGSLADNASSDLRRIRREQERQQRLIEEGLRATLRRLSEGGSTQDDLITIRGDRFVIPVKAEWKRRVSGVVHGASSSGQTVYVEPLETIEQNNELVRLLEEEQAEIHRIFLAMTRQVAGYAATIGPGAAVLAEVESLVIRSRFAHDFQCVRPHFADADNPALDLTNARHPLLEKRLRASGGRVVPLSIALTGDARQLIISGPNTGGKTVSLKTTGLLALMAQAGVPIPADYAVLPVFRSLLADIGDSQSIEQNLSTFSAHILNIDRISHLAGTDSLVLLDELGSATDPEEGAALAVAIAEYFLNARAWCLISTHHTSLKVYAANVSGVLNAAVGVDERTLVPNYQLRLGVPGTSAGINTAERLGLNHAIVSGARARLGSQTEDIAHFLEQLHRQLEAVTQERAHLRQREQEVAREKARLEAEGAKEARAKTREMELKLTSLLKDFEYQARETVRVIEDRAAQQKLSKEAERRIARLRREFSEQFNATVVAHNTGADRGDANAQPHVVRHVAVGDMVKLRSMGKTALVKRQIDESTFEVSIGAMKMRIARDDIAEVVSTPQQAGGTSSSPLQAARSRGVSVSVSEPDENMRAEINLIGRTADEATDELRNFLDRAFLAGLPRIRVVHGVGMGVLRRTLRAYLQQHPQVASIAEPPHNEGGAGVTLAELKQ
ncbi:MAG TPA: Smr/MutS family protein [Acidisarcina sp.]|nr:Smr/MutS family protein [Acidisarcina sp.]